MIVALFRTLYFLGPLLALAIIFMPVRRRLAWSLWAFAAAVVVFHWISFLTAQEENATEIGGLWVAMLTPLIITTAIAGLVQDHWRGWHRNPFISQGMVGMICLIPSIAAFFLMR